MTINKVLVLGASGDQAAPLLDQLVASNFSVRGACRHPEKIMGDSCIERVAVAFDDPGSLSLACKGIDAIVTSLPFIWDVNVAREMALNVARAARENGVGKIVFHTSCFVAEENISVTAHDARRIIESEFAVSGLDYVFIRSTVFMENLIRPWLKPAIVDHGVFAYPAGEDLAISWVCLADIARAMVAALRRRELRADALLVGGPEALTGREVAQRLSTVVEREVSFRSLAPEQFASDMSFLVTGSSKVQPHSIYAGMARLYTWYNSRPNSPLVACANDIEELLCGPLTSLEQWARGIDWNSPS